MSKTRTEPVKHSRKNKGEAPSTLTLNVLGYREDNEWVALALEMDIRGYGSTFESALKDLKGLVDMQIGFARYKGQPEMIMKPAEPRYWTLYSRAREDRMWELVMSSQPRNPEYTIGDLLLPPAHMIADFQLADA